MTRRTAWLGATGVVLILAVVVFVPELQFPPLSDAELQQVTGAETKIERQQAQGQLRNNARSVLLQAIAGLLVVVGATATWYQVRVNRDGQITDRYSRAIEHLGNDNVDIRIGGLYALERIANNSEEDRRFIQVTIGSFLRNRSPWAVGSPDGPEHPTPTVDETVPWLRIRAPDVQTALVILARQPKARDAPPVNLARADLRSAHMQEGDLSEATFRRSNLARAWLPGVRLDGCDLHASDLRLANLENASLRNSSLRNAHLEGANLRFADLRQADLRGAHADAKTIWPAEFTAEVRRDRGVVDSAALPPSD
ncbi:pentapeptide repeat-containing protein [Lentzea sp. PSKA42]|uniref:Pentapeptide repeat-containing protein n=1 Tax=Lentzea indica TaxID=2604800 RepID=A0ABX1FA87_9PSEU|nr:pentapeptide repeat-containing protein [Lentzea indica]NKE55829.1 pentapeptide repeat-containing protein [Lentzea indica]